MWERRKSELERKSAPEFKKKFLSLPNTSQTRKHTQKKAPGQGGMGETEAI